MPRGLGIVDANILGTPTITVGAISISGTPTVTMGAVSITGTPSVTMTAMTGTVTIAGTPTVTMGTVTANATITGGAGFIDTTGALKYWKTANDKPRVSTMPYLYDIAEANVTGHVPWSKIGYNDTIGTARETLWPYSTLYTFPLTAGQLKVTSDSTQDTLTTGTGAWTVRVGYLKSDYSEGSVTLNMNGTTAVPTGASHADIWRVNSFRVMSTGTNLAPVGNLTLNYVVGGFVTGYIRAGRTRARSAFYTVPLGKTLYITSFSMSVVGTKYAIVTSYINYDTGTNTILQRGLFYPYNEIALFNNAEVRLLELPSRIPATVDFKIDATAEAAGSLITCSLKGWEETN
jgi:hypothetical protein